MNRLQQRKLTRQERDSNPNACLLGNARTGSLLADRGIRVCLRERDIRERESGRGTSGRGTSGRETSARGPSARPSSPADLPRSCCSTSTSEGFPAASASRRVGAAGRDITGLTSSNTPAHRGYESPEFVVRVEVLGFVAVGQAPEVVAVG